MPDATWPVVYSYDEPQHAVVKASHTDMMSEVGRKSAEVLNGYLLDSPLQYQATDVLEQAKQLQELSAATNQQLLWIASISLLVGGNRCHEYYVSIRDRTNE